MKRLISVTSFTALLTLLRMLTGFIIAKVVAIYTGPAGMAMLGQVQSVVTLLNGVVSAPLGAGVVRYTAENSQKGFDSCAPWWRASLQWALALLTIVIPISCFFSTTLSAWLFDSAEFAWVIVVACFALPLSAVNILISSVLNGQQQYKRYIALGMISTLISTIVMVVLVYVSNLEGALLASAINAAIAGFIMLFFSLREPWFKLSYWWGKTNKTHRKKIGGYVIMALTSAIALPITLVMIRKILIVNVGWEEAGHWQAVWKISEVYLSVITLALGTYFLPKLASLSGVTAIRAEINSAVKVIIPIVAIMALIVYLGRDLAISILFTEEFRSARDLFAFQLLGDVVKVLAYLYAYPMLSRGATSWFVFNEITFSLLFVFLAMIFISIYGAVGVSMAYLLNYILCFIFIYFNVDKFAR